MNDTDVAYTDLELRHTGYLPDGGWQRNQIRESVGFAPQADCEADPARRELVVYTVVWRERDGRPEVLAGQRQPDAGEDRLHGDYFLGWGGHVERIDVKPQPHDLLMQAVRREVLRQELDVHTIDGRGLGVTYHGLLNDPSDDVGKDHLGLVYSVQVADATVREADKYGGGEWWPLIGDGWLQHDPIGGKLFARHDQMESWSQLLSGRLHDMVGAD